MIQGIGVDTVCISDLAMIAARTTSGGFGRMFTSRELAQAKEKPRPAEFLASRFAVKEAVFKAVAHLLEEKHFDLRQVETMNRPDGSPYVHLDGIMQSILDRAGVHRLHLSITTEGDFATAFVIAEAKSGTEAL